MGMCRSTGYAFCLSYSGTGYKNHTFSLEEAIFYFRFDSGSGSIFPRILINHDKVQLRNSAPLIVCFVTDHDNNSLEQCIDIYTGTGYLFFQCLSGTGSQIHLFPSGTGLRDSAAHLVVNLGSNPPPQPRAYMYHPAMAYRLTEIKTRDIGKYCSNFCSKLYFEEAGHHNKVNIQILPTCIYLSHDLPLVY